jgi:serine/threonine protein kinase
MGSELGPYVLLERLGLQRVTAAETFLGVNTRTGVPAVIKYVPNATSEAHQRAHQRVDALRTIDSPYLGGLIEAFAIGPGFLIAAVPLPGGDLRSRLDRGERPSPYTAFAIAAQVAWALAAMHEADLVHLDVKPSNVMVAFREDGSPHAWLIDLVPLGPGPEFTLDYAAPTLLRGEPGNASCDIYALGAMLFELVTGRVPYPCDTPDATIAAHLAGPPDGGPLLAAGLSESSIELVIRLMTDPLHAAWVAGLLHEMLGELPSHVEEDIVPPAPRLDWAADTMAGYIDYDYGQPLPSPAPPTAPVATPPPRNDADPGRTVDSPTAAPPIPADADDAVPASPPAPAPGPVEEAPSHAPSREDWAEDAGTFQPPSGQAPEEVTPTTSYTDVASVIAGKVTAGAVRAALEAAAAASRAVAEVADAVDCTVFAPLSTAPGLSVMVQVFLHTPGQAGDAAALASEFDTNAVRRGFRGLELPLPPGAVVEIELTVPGVQVDEPVQRLMWHGRAEAVQFTLLVPVDNPPPALAGTVIVRREGVPIGRVGFRVVVTPQATIGPTVPHTDRQRRFERAFASYATPDRGEVLKRVQVLRAAGIECFQDVLDLEPGQRWERELYRQIDRADLFLLFWSRAAKNSEWVRREVDYALGRQRGGADADPEIRPVVIEGPPVELPWPDLAYLHFFDPLVHLL